MAGRISKWERMETNQGRPRGIMDGAVYLRDKWWKEAFTDYDLDPPKLHTELVTRQGNRVYVVKWTPELARPKPTPGAEEWQPGATEEGPQLIWTKELLPGVGPLERGPPRTSQPGGVTTERGGTRAAVLGAGEGPTTSQAPATSGGQVTVRQVLNELLAQATQQLTRRRRCPIGPPHPTVWPNCRRYCRTY
jgi:hypothetical protein